MLPDNFDFAQLPEGMDTASLREIGILASTIETIDYAMVSWLKESIKPFANTNEGHIDVPVLWQTPERSYQIKNDLGLRDDGGALKLPLLSIERTGMTKDPNKKGGFQAQVYSKNRDGRPGRWVIAKRIVADKTRNFARVEGQRRNLTGKAQPYYPRINKKIVIQSLSIPIPVYVNVNYKIVLKTEYQQQMNELVTPFVTRTGQINSFVLKRNGHLYEAFIEQEFTHSNNIANLEEESRQYNTDINIRVLGYLIGEGDDDDRPIVRIDENTVEYAFPSESVLPAGLPNLFGETS
jgi:hypothetical protein